MYRCAAAFSGHPDPAVAVGEVVGGVLDRLDPHPDTAVVVMSGPAAAEPAKVVGAVQSLLAPDSLIGSTAAGVFGGPQDLSGTGGLALWACSGPGLRTVRFGADRIEPDRSTSPIAPGDVVLLLATPTFPVEGLVKARRTGPSSGDGIPDGLTTFVGLTAPARSRQIAALLTDGQRFHTDGAVGLVFPGAAARLFGIDIPDDIGAPDDIVDQDMIDEPGTIDGWPGRGPRPEIPEGAGALVLVDRSVPISPRWELEVEESLQRLQGTVVGIVGRAFTVGPGLHRRGRQNHHGRSNGGGDPRRTSLLVIGHR